MARARATAAQAGTTRPASTSPPATPPTTAPQSMATLPWFQRKGFCGTRGCVLKDFHDGPCSHLRLESGEVRSRKRAQPEAVSTPTRIGAKRAKPARRRKPPPSDRDAGEAECLIASRTSGGKRNFVVRWRDAGAKDDSWETEDRLPLGLVKEFDASHQLKAPYYGALFLVEQILARRDEGGRKQSRVKWFGYDWSPSWVDDDKLVAPNADAPLVPAQEAPASPQVARSARAAQSETPSRPTKFCIEKGPACGQIPRKARFCPECGADQE